MPRSQPMVIRTLRREDLRPICQTLNDSTMPGSVELQELVQRWWEYACDLRKMLTDNRQLFRELQDVAKVNLIPTADGAQLELRRESSDEGWADLLKHYRAQSADEGRRRAIRIRANFLFVELVLNPFRKALGRCNNPNCGRYFVKERIRDAENKYCDAACRGPAETLRKFHEERDSKLLQAHQYLYKIWPDKDWKTKLAKKLHVTPKWLTWAINRGDLHLPAKEGKQVFAGRPASPRMGTNRTAGEKRK